jgi:hypothetical protein
MIGNLMRCAATAIVALGALLAFQRGSMAAEPDMSVIARASSGPLSCEIRKAAAGDAIQLTGVVSSSVASTGQVRFLLTKSGKSGNSNINQSNAFELAAGAESHVSHVTINLQHEDHAVVEFVATAKDGATCRATANLEL